VEHYIKVRSRDIAVLRMEVHMLVNFAPGSQAIRCGWHNLADFMTELKALKAEHISDVGSALRKALDLANLYRMQSGVDWFAQGRKLGHHIGYVSLLLKDTWPLSTHSFSQGPQLSC
jgi:hypothetical protein